MNAAELITDAELQSLPEDPQLAFAELEKICRGRMLALVGGLNTEDWQPEQELRLTYYTTVAAAGRHYGIRGFDDLDPLSFGQFGADDYRNFVNSVTAATVPIRLRGASKAKIETVEIDTPTKLKIRKHLEALKTLIDKADLKPARKASLSRKLLDFEKALEGHRVSLAAAMAFVAAIAVILHDGSGSLEDLRKGVDDIAYLIGKAAAAEEAVRLHSVAMQPAPKLIEGPRTEEARDDLADLDDEVPF